MPFTAVVIDDSFWAPRLRVNRETTLPAAWRWCQETGRIDAFRLKWRPGDPNMPHIFWDSDVAKWLEAACYSLATHPDPDLEARVEALARLIVSAQQPDGYINTHFTAVEPDKRWTNLRDSHELYCAGHLMEAATAHHQATGKRFLLDALCRTADFIDTVFGDAEGRLPGYSGHEEIELALVKLHHASGNRRYLEMSREFVERRGRRPYYFDREARARGEPVADDKALRYHNRQAHLPVREQTEAVGHAVRAMYLYSAMADLARELPDPSLLAACRALWESVCSRKLYITGGVGATGRGEAFGADYDLPNATAYAETCAAIGLVFWSHRMLQAEGDARYADILERALYNGVLSGVSLDGAHFFYTNPLAADADAAPVPDAAHLEIERQPWFGCACCPTNIVRLLASLGGHIYGTAEDGIAVHLYAAGQARLPLPDGQTCRLRVETRYPWEGRVALVFDLDAPAEFTLRLRHPGWCRQAPVQINGQPTDAPLVDGYRLLRRTWNAGDRVEVDFAMPVERVVAHPRVAADTGQAALQRGPVVYCFEQIDQTVPVELLALPADAVFEPRYDAGLLGGCVVLEGRGVAAAAGDWNGSLYRREGETTCGAVPMRAIPYCLWANRGRQSMRVWLPRLDPQRYPEG